MKYLKNLVDVQKYRKRSNSYRIKYEALLEENLEDKRKIIELKKKIIRLQEQLLQRKKRRMKGEKTLKTKKQNEKSK